MPAVRKTLWMLTPSLLLVVLALPAPAADYFLTLGGGYTASGNQISLEKNVKYFQRVLANVRPDDPRHDVYFADGTAPGRDLQFSDPDSIPRANRLMAEIFGDLDDLELQYRNHAVEGIQGATSIDNLDRWVSEVGGQMVAGDRLFVYVTAHGGKSKDTKEDPYNTRLFLWGNKSISARQFADRLGKLPEHVTVIVVMVQCYGGGFASLIFDDANQDQPTSARDVCGFFATTHARPAAGCTPDIDEENYQEYSTFFWEGLSAISRLGDPVAAPDYDGDGHVSFGEAHAYVLLQSDTVDIPTKTSGMFLRKYSELGDRDHPGLLSVEINRDELIKHATPSDEVVIDGLTAALDLPSPTVREARRLARRVSRERSKLRKELDGYESQKDDLLDDLADGLEQRWPELANPFHPAAIDLVTTNSGQFVAAVESHPAYSELGRLTATIERIEAERFTLRKKWVKCQRLIRTIENVVYASNLAAVADDRTCARFKRLCELEQGLLTP